MGRPPSRLAPASVVSTRLARHKVVAGAEYERSSRRNQFNYDVDPYFLYLDDKPIAAVAVLSRDVKNPIHETNSAIAAIGRAVYDFYSSQAGG